MTEMLAVALVNGGRKCGYHVIPGALLRLFKMLLSYIRI